MVKAGTEAKDNLTSQSIDVGVRAILALALPAIIENILQVLLGVADTYFVSRIGTEAIAAVGVTNLSMNVYIAFFMAVGVGTTALVSRCIGANLKTKARRSVEQALLLALILGGVFGTGNYLLAASLLKAFGAEKTVLFYAVPYFKVVAGPIVLLGITYALSSALRASGDTRTPMKAALAANIVNVVLDYILIFGAFGIPAMGIAGAAMATSLSRLINAAILIWTLQHSQSPLKVSLGGIIKLDKALMGTIIKIGGPAGGEKLIMRCGQLVYGGMIISIGTSAYAAHNIAGTIESLSYLPGMGFGIAASTLVGQCLGANDKARAYLAGQRAYILGTGFMVGIGAVFFILARPLVSIFSGDQAVVDQAVSVLRIIAFFQPFLCSTLVVTSALQGAGDTKFPALVSLLGIWGIRVAGVYILCVWAGYGLIGVWTAYAVDVTLRGSILYNHFKNRRWASLSYNL